MQIFRHRTEIGVVVQKFRKIGLKIGFVPTMGALHQGHLSLVDKALKENERVIVSIFVNPTQFDNADDLTNYPRQVDQDVELLKTLNTKNIIVYAPTVADIYQNAIRSEHYTFGGLEHEMEGQFREGHFNGVATVVRRLLEIVKPDKAYFGEKDFQQLQIIRSLVEQLGMAVEIVGCPIKREPHGLAMSSRNSRLTKVERQEASLIYRILLDSKVKFGTKSAGEVTNWVVRQFYKHEHLKLEYFIIADTSTLKPVKRKSKKKKYRAFIAAFAGDVRLIDNIALN
ncbi:MAG: pantoate--beta-alanine ligase [Bacteroidia bacterium]|nr:pantoate--beta-alanine ligase [Bacteroidia bacterium]NNK73153.1 pantoate--beta-alanine ligase [Flavobacteriaceae bacterium]